MSNPSPTVGDSITITGTIRNIGYESANTITVRLLDNDVPVSETVIAAIASGSSADVVFTIEPLLPAGGHEIIVDHDDTVPVC